MYKRMIIRQMAQMRLGSHSYNENIHNLLNCTYLFLCYPANSFFMFLFFAINDLCLFIYFLIFICAFAFLPVINFNS